MTVSQQADIGAPVKMRTASSRRHCLAAHVLNRRHVVRQNTAAAEMAAEMKVLLSLAEGAVQARIEECRTPASVISAPQRRSTHHTLPRCPENTTLRMIRVASGR
jgi:hypothetical protein